MRGMTVLNTSHTYIFIANCNEYFSFDFKYSASIPTSLPLRSSFGLQRSTVVHEAEVRSSFAFDLLLHMRLPISPFIDFLLLVTAFMNVSKVEHGCARYPGGLWLRARE